MRRDNNRYIVRLDLFERKHITEAINSFLNIIGLHNETIEYNLPYDEWCEAIINVCIKINNILEEYDQKKGLS